MAQRRLKKPADYIVPLNINRLEGRMLHVPASSVRQDRQILLVYGHHAMLERWWGLVENLAEYGAVTMPDLPGFGGMDSFESIGRKPTIDAYADYLAAFVKLRFRRKRVTVYAISFGFVVVTRMLQRYPELTKKVDVLISAVGFMHKDDFLYSRPRRIVYRYAARLVATRPLSLFIRYCCYNKTVLRPLYRHIPTSKRRFIDVAPEEFELTIEFEVRVWQANDVRTHWLTTYEFMNLDNCLKRVELPVVHVIAKYDHYFNNEIIKQHMLVVFKGYRRFVANSKAHTPNMLADKKASGVMVPPGLRHLLAKPVK
jgi:pimeloyl-ACP methyl ester carboxylesterase